MTNVESFRRCSRYQTARPFGPFRPRCLLTLWLTVASVVIVPQGESRADQASAHYHKALALKRAGDTKRAIVELRAALQAREAYAAAHYSIGILYRKQGETQRSIFHLERATALDPKNGQAYYSLALAYFAARRKGDALIAMRTAAELLPKDARVASQLGVLMIRQDPFQAIKFLKRAMRLEPNDPEHQHQLGLAYRKATSRLTGDANETKRRKYLRIAEKHMLAAAVRKPTAGLHFDLGVVYRRLGERKEAIRHYERAIALDNKFAAAYWDVAHIYTMEKRYNEAIGAYETYRKLSGATSGDAKIAQKRIRELKKRKQQ